MNPSWQMAAGLHLGQGPMSINPSNIVGLPSVHLRDLCEIEPMY